MSRLGLVGLCALLASCGGVYSLGIAQSGPGVYVASASAPARHDAVELASRQAMADARAHCAGVDAEPMLLGSSGGQADNGRAITVHLSYRCAMPAQASR